LEECWLTTSCEFLSHESNFYPLKIPVNQTMWGCFVEFLKGYYLNLDHVPSLPRYQSNQRVLRGAFGSQEEELLGLNNMIYYVHQAKISSFEEKLSYVDHINVIEIVFIYQGL
jgi:hypothetical protein